MSTPSPAPELPSTTGPPREPPREAPATAPPAMTPPAPSVAHQLHWRVHLEDFARWLAARLGRPRVRLTATGVLLLLIGGLVVTSSVWTLPLVIIGALMVLVAWIGSRLDGHFAVEWGETGTQLQFRAQIRCAEPPALKAGHGEPASGAASSATDTAPTPAAPAPAAFEPPDAEIVEGEAHTVEIDVAELKALIAAAEAVGDTGAPSEPSKIAAFRVARTGRP